MNDEILLETAEALEDFGRQWARRRMDADAPLTILVVIGDLGAGKTTLMKGVAEGWGVAQAAEVTSPTYTLIHEYRRAERSLYHLDLYRIENQPQLETLGLEDILAAPAPGERRLVAIEWGERIEAELPQPYFRLEIRTGANEVRHLNLAEISTPSPVGTR